MTLTTLKIDFSVCNYAVSDISWFLVELNLDTCCKFTFFLLLFQWLPLFHAGHLQTGEFCLPVMIERPPPNYSYIHPDVLLPGTKWVDNHKGIFCVNLEAVSSVHTQVRAQCMIG